MDTPQPALKRLERARRMLFKRQNRFLGKALTWGILMLALFWPKPGLTQEILQSTDKFSGATHYSTRLRETDLEGGSFFSNRTVRFNFNAYQPGPADPPYSLGVQTLTREWVFIPAGISLDLKLDGSVLMHLTGVGSSGLREVISGNLVREDAFYDLSADQLNTIAHAKSIEFRLYGDSQIITGRLPARFLLDASAFATALPASGAKTVSPEQPGFGIRYLALNPTAIVAIHLSDDHGLIVLSVDPASRAEKIGLQKSDVILSINNVPTRSGSDLPKGMAAATAGKTTIHIWRGGALIDLQSDQSSEAK